MVEKITNWKLKIISLYRTNYMANFYLRELAKLLNTTHVTLIPHLKDLEKDNILISKKVGKNKTFFLNFNNILTKDFISMAEMYKTNNYLEKVFLIKKIYDMLLKLSLQGSIILFGSYVKDYKTELSDIDLFYLGSLSKEQIHEIKKIGKIYGKQINVKKASLENFEKSLHSGSVLIKEIIKNHIILNNSDSFVNALWRYYGEIR